MIALKSGDKVEVVPKYKIGDILQDNNGNIGQVVQGEASMREDVITYLYKMTNNKLTLYIYESDVKACYIKLDED